MRCSTRSVLLWAGLACSMLFSAGAIAGAASNELKVGVDSNLKPFVYTASDGTVQGFDIEIAENVCKDLGKKCKYVQMEWDGLIPSLTTGKIDVVISSMTVTDQRKRIINFSSSYYKTPSYLVGDLNVTQEKDLYSRGVGVLRGSIDQTFLTEVLAPRSGLIPVTYSNQNEMFLDLAAGRLSAILAPQLEAQAGIFDVNPEAAKKFHFIGKGYEDQAYYGYGVGAGIAKNRPDLLAGINKSLEDQRADGRYQKINAKYFAQDIWGE